MNGRRPLTQFDLLVMLATLRLGEGAYGVSIAGEIETATGRAVALASLYVALDRIEREGLVRSELGEPTAERGGRAKRYFQVTPKGLAEVRAARRLLTKMWSAIPELQGGLTGGMP